MLPVRLAATEMEQMTYPPRQYPRERTEYEPGTEPEFTREWANRVTSQILKSLEDMAQFYKDQTNRVDEFRPQSLAGESLTVEVGQPDYECSEIIESVLVTGPTGPGLAGDSQNENRVATPAAAALIASVTPGVPGLYSVQWTVGVEVAAATLADNYKLVSPLGTTIASAIQPVAIGEYPQSTALVYVSTAAQAISVQTVATEATATIAGEIVATPYAGYVPFQLKLGGRVWNLQLPPTGILAVGPVSFKLGRSDTRQLIASVAGDWAFELMGHAETGRMGRV